jgi:hypothetical protein
MGVVMIDPELSYLVWKFEQSRRDRKLERQRAYLGALELEPLLDPAGEHGEEPAPCELGVAS